jgi:signal transduction histidine kinase
MDQPGGPSRSVQDRLVAIMAVSRAVAEAEALEETLDTISRTAAQLVGATGAAIILRTQESATGLAVAGAHGLSEEYAEELNRIRPIEVGKGPSGVAAAKGTPVAVADALVDPIFKPWRRLARREHYRAMVSVPLRLGANSYVIGVLNAYRSAPGEWTRNDIDLLLSLADHAAIAIRTAQLLDESRRQVRGLSLVVRSLRTQSHEHSNLLHAVYGLLALGEVDEALGLIASSDTRYHSAYAQATERIENTTLSGFLVAEALIAGNSGINLRVDGRSRLRALPPGFSDLDAITILGNLLHNATEAVSDVPKTRRRVTVLVSDRNGELVLRVRDWGLGIAARDVPRVFTSGYSTKADHVGIGLSMVRSIATRARGDVAIERPSGTGTAIRVRIPF